MSLLQEKIYGGLIGGLIGDAMGAPCEGWDYHKIEETYGWISGFDGAGTDDSAIKQILCDAIFQHDGDVTADEWAEAFLLRKEFYPLFFIPVQNMFHKLESRLELPVYCGLGNMQSSSSAMSIAPLGMINACNPYLASMQTYDVAGLIHAGATTFCRDGACAISAAVAEAMRPGTTVEAVVRTASSYLHPWSSREMTTCIHDVMECVKACDGGYQEFRSRFYDRFLRDIISDSRETVPCALALFWLANGDPAAAVTYAANFGRDSDTLGAMVGGLAGAYAGISAFPKEWVGQIESQYGTRQPISKEYDIESIQVADQRRLAERLALVASHRYERFMGSYQDFSSLQG